LIGARSSGLKVVLGFPAETITLDSFLGSLVAIVGQQLRGYFNLSTDPDQVIRSCVLYETDRASGMCIPAVSLAVAANQPGVKSFSFGPQNQLFVGSEAIPNLIDGKKGAIDFLGPDKTFRMESFQKVMDDAASDPASLRRFAGKTVLVGVTETVDRKMVPTGFMYGIEIHANIIENIRRRSFLKVIPDWAAFGLLLVLGVTGAMTFSLGVRREPIAVLFLAIGWLGVVFVSFRAGLVLPCARPELLVVMGSVLEGIRRYRRLDADKRKIRELFGRYVNDSVVEDLLELPREKLFEGYRRQICVMFSDIRGFTSFSENRDPADVVRFLNIYFGGLTRIIMKHHGTVDKFLGDGLMAFFNAPIERQSFIGDAVRAAIEIREFVAGDEIRRASDSFSVRVGISLHVGPAVVGNVGSERKTEFTAIGDTVNTASRLESLNKEYRTDIIVSGEVVQASGDAFSWRALGEAPIRGKESTVRLFTLIRFPLKPWVLRTHLFMGGCTWVRLVGKWGK